MPLGLYRHGHFVKMQDWLNNVVTAKARARIDSTYESAGYYLVPKVIE